MPHDDKDKRGIYGPYPNRGKWRVAIIDPVTGGRSAKICRTEKEAKDLIAELRGQRGSPLATTEEALDAYLTYLKTDRGRKPKGIKTTGHRLRKFVGAYLKEPASALTPWAGQRCYDAYQTRDNGQPRAADTHRNALKEAKTFGDWLERKGYVDEAPFDLVEAVGRRHYGKKQLRVSEARLFIREAQRLWVEDKEPGALVVLTKLLLGTRSEELLRRKVRDLDDEGRILWMGDAYLDDTKTEGSRRRLEVPEELRPHLLRLVKGKALEDPLWPCHSCQWILDWTKRICEKSGVPIVVAHSLRGLHATLAEAAGVSSHLVSSSLGWTNETTKNAHYVTQEAQGIVKQARALKVLEGGR